MIQHPLTTEENSDNFVTLLVNLLGSLSPPPNSLNKNLHRLLAKRSFFSAESFKIRRYILSIA